MKNVFALDTTVPKSTPTVQPLVPASSLAPKVAASSAPVTPTVVDNSKAQGMINRFATSVGRAQIFGVPIGTIADVAKAFGQGVARVGGSAVLSASQALGGPSSLAVDNKDPNAPFQKAIFGSEPLESYQNRIASATQTATKLGAGKYASIFGAAGVLGGDALNFLGGEEEAAKFVKGLAAESDVAKVTEKLIAQGFAKDIAEAYAPKIAETADKSIVRNMVDKATELQLGTTPTLKAFGESTGQKVVGTIMDNKFELGSFGEAAGERKGVKADRFPKSELEDTLSHVTSVTRASDDAANYRSGNRAWIAEMPDGEKRVIYTRPNANGAEEIINWHRVDETKNPNYLKTLESFGAPDRIQTDIPNIEGRSPVQLDDKGVGTLPESTAMSRRLINPDYFAVSDDAKAKIADTIEGVRPELEAAKGEPLTHEEVLKAAADSDVLRGAVSRDQTLKQEAALLKLRQEVSALAEGKGVSPEFLSALERVSNQGTAIARQLESFKILATPEMASNKEYLIRQLLDLGVKSQDILDAAKGVNFDNANEANEFFRKFVKPTLPQILDEYRYINLLSSPRTHIVNSFTNILQASILDPATKLASGLVDAVGSSLTGAERAHYVGEVKPYYRGAINSIPEAVQSFLGAFKGETPLYRPDVAHIPTGSPLLAPFQAIPRLLEASDVFFRTLISAGERESLAYKAVRNGEVLDDVALAKIKKEAEEKAAYYVFRQSGDPLNKGGQGNLLSAIDKFTSGVYSLRKVPGVKWFIPFVQTPMNILKQGLEYSPLGFLTAAGAADRTEQVAKALIGSTVFAGAGSLALEGRTTWAAPTADKEKATFYASGRKPYSVKIGNNWYSFTKLGPLAYPIAMAAAVQWYTHENPHAATDSAEKKLLNVVGGIGGFFSDQSYVQGMNNLLQALSGDPTSIKNAVTTAPGQLVPLSSLLRWTSQLIDPVYRQSDTDFSIKAVIQNIQKGIPFLSKMVSPELDPLKRPSVEQHPYLRAFTPFDTGTTVPGFEKALQTIHRTQRLNILKKAQKAGAASGGMVSHF